MRYLHLFFSISLSFSLIENLLLLLLYGENCFIKIEKKGVYYFLNKKIKKKKKRERFVGCCNKIKKKKKKHSAHTHTQNTEVHKK